MTALTGEWATTVSTVLQLNKVAFINDEVWACGGGTSGSAIGGATCVLANYNTGEVYTQYTFGWDTVTSVTTISVANKVYIGGRTAGSASTTSAVANCAIEPVQLTCTVKSFLNTNFLGSSYSPLTSLIVYVGRSSAFATATIVDAAGVAKEKNYYYVSPSLTSFALLRAVSPPSFVGAFVAGTGVSGASTNRIVAGWVRLQTGDLTAIYLVPSHGTISNSADLVTSMALEPTGPDTFIVGALQLSASTTSGVWGYLLRANALYSTVQFGVRYVPKASRRRLSAFSVPFSGISRGVTRADNFLFIISDYKTSNSTSLSLIKADAATGAIIKQATVSSHNASIACTDITTAALLLDITCTVQRSGALSQQAQLISVDRELSFTRLPSGFKRGGNSTFTTESVAFTVSNLPNTRQNTAIATTDSTVVISNQMPTMSPSVTPTLAPSAQPTSMPSARPSSSPTSAPSVSPQPTSHPSTSGPTGTHKPSREPTVRPTAPPTVTSSVRPSKSPTAVPSVRPTTTPTSARPSVTPSVAPTVTQTAAPSAKPTIVPTVQPSRKPTVSPTLESTAISADDDAEIGHQTGTPQYVIAVSVVGGVLLIGLCAFLFYKRHDLRVKEANKKFFKVIPNAEGAPSMWLEDESPEVLMLASSTNGSDGTHTERHANRQSQYTGAGAGAGTAAGA